MSKNYEPSFKKKLVTLHLNEGRTLQSLSAEYKVSKASIVNVNIKMSEKWKIKK